MAVAVSQRPQNLMVAPSSFLAPGMKVQAERMSEISRRKVKTIKGFVEILVFFIT